MRLWSLHPGILDRAALIAGWREALLAQKVLWGETTGYRHHPQLERFRAAADPTAVIAAYLHGLADEADARGYRFDRGRIRVEAAPSPVLTVTAGQLAFELEHLRAKLSVRAPHWPLPAEPTAHPLFTVVDGPIEPWERAGRTQP